MARRHPLHRSTTRQEGYLCDVSIDRLMNTCREHGASGTLRIESWGRCALMEWQSGQLLDARLEKLRGAEALEQVRALRDGTFSLRTSEPVDLRATAPVPARMESGRFEAPPQLPACGPMRRPGPPPLPTSRPTPRPLRRPVPSVPGHAPSIPTPLAAPSAGWDAASGHGSVQSAPYGSFASRLRLPGTALSVGIFCATMLASLVAVAQF